MHEVGGVLGYLFAYVILNLFVIASADLSGTIGKHGYEPIAHGRAQPLFLISSVVAAFTAEDQR